jgi:hypothetical protein
MKADTEDEVISLLEEAGYWENTLAWRNYGDNESNFSTIGNQSSRPLHFGSKGRKAADVCSDSLAAK